jgi:flagellar FliJ protein
MSWARSLVRISNHEVETLQKRVAEVTGRRVAIEQRIARLDAEVQAEVDGAAQYETAGLYLAGYREGAKLRRAALESSLVEVQTEEAGARDALAEAFETLKKYEKIVEMAEEEAAREEARRETAELDEVGIRGARRS